MSAHKKKSGDDMDDENQAGNGPEAAGSPAEEFGGDGPSPETDPAAADSAGESEDYYERYLRLTADFENFKRRRAQEFVDQSRYASEAAARALLPVLDNLERALEHAPAAEEAEAFVEGVRIATRNFVSTLEELGVTPVDAVGKPFDPAVHEAIGGEDSTEVEVDTVTAEIQRGWKLHDRLLRPAIVRIATPAKED
jgi:molecular chaperone GrpE